MIRKGLTLIAALGLVGASVPSAQADLCFHYGSGGGKLVAKGAEFPQPDECKTLSFFEVDLAGGLAGAATGSICRATNAGSVIFHYSYHGCLDAYFETGTCVFAGVQNGLPTGGAVGACRNTFNQTNNPNPDNSPVLQSCNEPVPEYAAQLCGKR